MVFGALCLLMVTGCRPHHVLSPRQMEDIFVDLHRADGILQEAGYHYGHDEALRGYYQAILEQHGTTQQQFDSSLVWYTAHPGIFDKIYPKVIDRLQAELDDYVAHMDQNASDNADCDINHWLEVCQEGYNRGPWHKKIEKSAEKFVYVKKI